jgi:hypothetical protein
MIREQKFYDTSDFDAVRLKQVGEHYVAEQEEEVDIEAYYGSDFPEDTDGWGD